MQQIDLNIVSEKIITKTTTKNEKGYKVLKYDEKYVCDNDEKLGKYRSLVVSDPENELLCYTPPKSITPELFKERYPELTDDIIVNEAIEGTMISLFWDSRLNQWEIATKGAISGNYWFFRTKYKGIDKTTDQKTFRRMFLDALRANASEDICDLAIFDSLIKENICYNFVLQHPENHIVLKIDNPKLYLVSIYKINGSTAELVSPHAIWPQEFAGMVELPSEDFEKDIGYNGLYDRYCSNVSPESLAGLMFTNIKTGDRTCFENAAYKTLRELRGNNPNLHYQFLCLKRMDKVLDFVGHFPQYKKLFFWFHKQYEDFITQLHQSYLSYYIKKTGENISKKYFPIIYKLHHEVYLPSIATEKIIMKRAEVKKQVLQMPPSEIIYYLYKD